MPGYAIPEVPYVGIVALALACLAGAPRRRDGALLLAVLVATSVLIALKLIGLEPVQTLAQATALQAALTEALSLIAGEAKR